MAQMIRKCCLQDRGQGGQRDGARKRGSVVPFLAVTSGHSEIQEEKKLL